MAARDGASSVQGTKIRVTRLNTDGSIDANFPVLVSEGFISASFSPQFEDGEEINEKAANGAVCVAWKADDTMTRLDFNLSLCTPDPEITSLVAGGGIIRDENGEVVGYTSVGVGDVVGNPVAIEIWSYANVGGKPAAGQPYWHWVFPYVKVRHEGDREFSNGLLGNEYSGQALGNAALASTGLNPANADDDYVAYRAALNNPFSYVRTASQPDNAPLLDGDMPEQINDVGPSGADPFGVIPGTPGTFIPTGADIPANLSALNSMGDLGETTAWSSGQYVELDDASHAYWNGSTWVAGEAGS